MAPTFSTARTRCRLLPGSNAAGEPRPRSRSPAPSEARGGDSSATARPISLGEGSFHHLGSGGHCRSRTLTGDASSAAQKPPCAGMRRAWPERALGFAALVPCTSRAVVSTPHGTTPRRIPPAESPRWVLSTHVWVQLTPAEVGLMCDDGSRRARSQILGHCKRGGSGRCRGTGRRATCWFRTW